MPAFIRCTMGPMYERLFLRLHHDTPSHQSRFRRRSNPVDDIGAPFDPFGHRDSMVRRYKRQQWERAFLLWCLRPNILPNCNLNGCHLSLSLRSGWKSKLHTQICLHLISLAWVKHCRESNSRSRSWNVAQLIAPWLENLDFY